MSFLDKFLIRCPKYLTVLRDKVQHVLGKLEGFLITFLVFPHRDWIRNYAWNYMRINGIECERNTIYSEDDTKYYTKNGFILKRKTNRVLGKVVMWLYSHLEDNS